MPNENDQSLNQGNTGSNNELSVESTNNQFRKCPQCAEQVRIEAIKCKHCGCVIPGEGRDQFNQQRMSSAINKIGNITKVIYPAIAALILLIGSLITFISIQITYFGIPTGRFENDSLYDIFKGFVFIPIIIAFIQAYFIINKKEKSALVAGVIGALTGGGLMFGVANIIHTKGLSAVTETQWTIWLYIAGLCMLLNPLLNLIQERNERYNAKKLKK